MMRDVHEEFAGSCSTLKDKHKSVEGGQVAKESVQLLNPQTQALKWMKEHQRSYTDAQLDFWLLLRPLTDGGEESSQHLACRLLSVALGISLGPPICPPAPSALNIGHWLQEGHKEDDRQCWIEACACFLPCVAEPSVGRCWVMEGKDMVPKVSSLVETFMATTGTCMPPHVV